MFSRNDIYIDDRDKSKPLNAEQRRQMERILELAQDDEDDLTAEGKLICGECPVRLSCLTHFFTVKESNDLMFGGYCMWKEEEQAAAYEEYANL